MITPRRFTIPPLRSATENRRGDPNGSGRHSSTSSPFSMPARPPLPAVTRSGRAGRSIAVERLAARRTTLRRAAAGFAAVAVVGATLTLTAGAGQATGGPVQDKTKAPAFVGYSVTGSASPLKIEIYEPTIPIPAEPQAEISVGYSAVTADTASSRARASYLWPGAAIGEGFKTVAENLGLPPQISGPIGENGYPIQVNAQFPNGPEAESNEPGPGMIQRAVAGQDTARADNGASTDGETDDSDDSGGSGGSGGPGGPPPPASPIPGLPGAPGLPGLGATGSKPTAATRLDGRPGAAKAPAAAPALPAPLAALVDLGGFTSTSRTENDSDAFVQSRSIANDITILGGVVSIGAVKTVANASSDGKVGQGNGVAEYGNLVIAGQTFKFTPDGLEATGTALPIPGLPAQGMALLKELGITISTPKPVYTIEGDASSTFMPGLRIEFDLTALKKKSGALTDAAATVIAMLPDDQGAPIKSGLQAAVFASPRMVFFAGQSFAGVDTSQAIAPPPPPTVEPTDEATADPAAAGGSGGGGASSGGAAPAPPVDSGPIDSVPAGDLPVTDQAAPELVSSVPGLPPLLSFPGLLLYGGLAGAGLAGFFVRRLGLLALGAAGSCPHGLVSGLPDLRKV